MKCYIAIFNLHTWPEAMISDVVRLGMEPVLIDNKSKYPPCLRWIRSSGLEVIRPDVNHGPKVFWSLGLDRKQKERYVVTDCDLDLSGMPDDFIGVASRVMDENEDMGCVGASIRFDDIPDSYPFKNDVIANESRHWNTKRGDHYEAEIDTTFAMYDPNRKQRDFYHAIRLSPPYQARHLPWYIDLENIDEEMRFYLKRVSNYAFWSNAHKNRIEGK